MEFHLYLNGAQAGPFTEQQVRAMLESGAIKESDFIWREGLAHWQPLGQVIDPSPPAPDPEPPAAAPPVEKPVVKQRFIFYIALAVFCLAACAVGLWMWIDAQHAASVQKLAQAQREIDSEIRKSVKDPAGGLAAAQQELDRYSQQLGSAANALQGSDKLEAAARQHYSQLFSAQLQKYSQAFQALNAAGFIQPKGINTKEDLQRRRELARDFADANSQLADFYRNSKEIMRGELEKEKLSADYIDSAMRDFEASANVNAALQIRQLEGDLVEQAGKIFDIYEREWGNWSLDAQGAIVFKNSAAFVDYDNALGAIKQITEQQKTIQQQVLQKSGSAVRPR